MDKEAILEKTRNFAKLSMTKGDSGHDWHHVERVWKLAKRIAKEEGADMFIVEVAALLHDVDDWKFSSDTSKTEKFLDATVDEETKEKVMEIINNLSFKGEGEVNRVSSKEGMAVQDADRLDAIGAIGIARCFSYSGHKQRPMYDPNTPPIKNMTFEQYKKNAGTAVNHFYEKLLLVREMMNTEAAREIARERHEFMEKYLEQFFKEWNSVD